MVPTRDSMRTLAACLESIRAQDVPVELVVVDNDSTDGTYELAGRLADMAVRGGPERSAQRNIGVRLTATDWVLWIDSDMVLPPETVSAALATARFEQADAVAIPEVSVGPGFWTACRALERACYVDDPSLHNPRLLRRELLLGDAEFDPAMAGPEDTDLRLRLRRSGTRTALCPDVFIVHDEGRLTLRSVLTKRVYYGRSLPAFAAKNPGALAGQGAGTLQALIRHRRMLARHPVRTGGMLLMRALEAAAYVVGYQLGRRR
ncbi:MAG TPA: glycosyltransferase family A protein [Mycobacteriales bacterium]|nr:glycosyltransferase family A protein [Mycobacteriales bacterium]